MAVLLGMEHAAALGELFDRWANRLLAYLIAFLRDRHRAEDALSNLFVKLAASPVAIADEAAYLYRAARNEGLRLATAQPHVSLTELGVIHPRPASDGQPESAELVARALDRLPPEQAEVLVLHALEGLTFREIGTILGVSPNTAASRYRYALARLREEVHA